MFWKEPTGLKNVSISSKVAITAFLIIAGIGYLLGFANIVLSYSPVDQEPGLSIRDIQISFYGEREKTALEGSIDGTMKEYFNSEADYSTVKEWLANGATEESFSSIKPIFEASCNMCHSSDAEVAGVVTETYQDIEPFLAQDMGKSISRLVSLSHTHVLATLPVVFLLFFVFSFTKFREGLKIGVAALSFAAIIFDVGAWWLAKLALGAAPLVILGGISLAISFALLVLLSLYDMWLRKA